MSRQESVLRYERLRDGQLRGGRPSRERELFMQCGMLGWLNAWSRYAPLPGTVGRGVDPQPAAAAAAAAPSVPWNESLAEVLATMTWAVFC